MLVNNIELSPEATGTLAALVDSWQIATASGRKFRYGSADSKAYAELVAKGFAEAFQIHNGSTRYELITDVVVPEPEARHNAHVAPVVLTDAQREMVVRERLNDQEISRAITNGKHNNAKFSDRCLGNYENLWPVRA